MEGSFGTQVRLLVFRFRFQCLPFALRGLHYPFQCNNSLKPMTILSINRWRNHLDLRLHTLWKISAQTQSTTSHWQPSLTKESEPSPMTYCRRPCKPVCSALFSLFSCSLCVLVNKVILPKNAVKSFVASQIELNSDEILYFIKL